MHSTIQTGLINYDMNYHYHPGASHPPHNHFPPPSSLVHHQKNEKRHNLELKNRSKNELSKPGSTSINASLLNLTLDGDLKRQQKLALSTSNLPKFLSTSNSNLDKVSIASNHNHNHCPKKRGSLDSSSSVPQLYEKPKLNASNHSNLNTNNNLLLANLNNLSASTCSQINNNSNSTRASTTNLRIAYKPQNVFKKNFWECTKPCGILTVAIGTILIVSSMIGFLFLFENQLCAKTQTCSNALLKVCSLCCLVIGILSNFFGIVIIIYTKRDDNTQVVILTKSKHIDKADLEQIDHQQHNGHNSNQRIYDLVDLNSDSSNRISSRMEKSHSQNKLISMNDETSIPLLGKPSLGSHKMNNNGKAELDNLKCSNEKLV
jgi:hypothetical protein